MEITLLTFINGADIGGLKIARNISDLPCKANQKRSLGTLFFFSIISRKPSPRLEAGTRY